MQSNDIPALFTACIERDRATAECAAKVYACLKAKEDAHV